MSRVARAPGGTASGWTWLHTVLAVAVWVLGIIPPALLAAWLHSTHHSPTLVTVGAFIGTYLPVVTTGTVVLLAHAELRESASPTGAADQEQRQRAVTDALKLIGALAAIGAGGTAAVVGIMYGIGYLAQWLHHALRLPPAVAGIVGSIVVLGSLIAPAAGFASRSGRADGLRDDAATMMVDQPAGHPLGPRGNDPLVPADVESVTGKRVRTLVRTAETVTANLDWAAVEEFWELTFALEAGAGIRCAAHGHTDGPAPAASAKARAYRRRGYREVETLARPWGESVAGTAPGSHHVVWTQLDHRWTIEITLPVSFRRTTGFTLLHCAVDRLQRLTASGALPVASDDRAGGAAGRLPEPLRADDFLPILGYPADPPDDEQDSREPYRSDTGWWGDYWNETFFLRGGEAVVELRVHGTRGDAELLAYDRQAWAQLGPSRLVDTGADDAFLVEGACPFEHDDGWRSLWASLGDRWVLQVIASPDIPEAQLVGLANVVISRLKGSTIPTQ